MSCAGMHKKSMEASQKLKEEEERGAGAGEEGLSRLASDVEDRRAESIKLLRAKAQSYSAARLMMHGVLQHAGSETPPHHHHQHITSGFQSPAVTMLNTGC